ncbi:hypothetical protein J3A83DRAFT_586736 [Scleroderma citrinum]
MHELDSPMLAPACPLVLLDVFKALTYPLSCAITCTRSRSRVSRACSFVPYNRSSLRFIVLYYSVCIFIRVFPAYSDHCRFQLWRLCAPLIWVTAWLVKAASPQSFAHTVVLRCILLQQMFEITLTMLLKSCIPTQH